MRAVFGNGGFYALVVFFMGGCVSVEHNPRDFDRVGPFGSFVDGISEARFSGHAVGSGWYFRVCGQGVDLDGIKHEGVRVLVKNEGPVVWVDYLSGSALLKRGDSVVVYGGALGHLVEQCKAHEWRWVVFKRDAPDRGTVKLLIVMEFEDEQMHVRQPISLDAWYSKVVPRK